MSGRVGRGRFGPRHPPCGRTLCAMDPSPRSTAAATVVVVALVVLAIAVLVTVGGGGSGPPTASPTTDVPAAPTTPLGGTAATPVPVETPTGPTRPGGSGGPGGPGPSQTPGLQSDGTVCVPQVDKKTITVMSFNIKSARVTGRADLGTLGTVGEQIEVFQPDIVLLQEVDRGRAWSDFIDMPALLAERLGLEYTFGANVVRSPTNLYGNAILSRFPVTASTNTPLPRGPGNQQRGLLSASLDVDGIPLEVYNTHLESSSSNDRERQMAVVARILGASTVPRFVGGDFNAGPTSAVLARARSVVRDTWDAVGTGSGLTAPSGSPRVRIDYLMYAGGGPVEITPLRMEVLPTNASDHRAVMASYQLTRDRGEICLPVID